MALLIKLMVDVAWAVFNGKTSGETKISIGFSKWTFSNLMKHQNFQVCYYKHERSPETLV